jgi:hypothetical protein
VLTLSVLIPGLGGASPFSCGANIGETPRELNGEVYGDWTFEIDGAGRASAGEASLALTFVDDLGTMSTIELRGPIESGSLPTTYSGGANGGACFHGYGSTG